MAATVCLPLDISKAAIVVDNLSAVAMPLYPPSSIQNGGRRCRFVCISARKKFSHRNRKSIYFFPILASVLSLLLSKQFRLQLLDCPVEWGIRAAGRAHPRLRLAPDEMRGPSFLVKSSDLPCTYCSCPSTHFPFSDGAEASHLCKQASTIRPVLLSRSCWRPSAFSVFGDSLSCALEVGVEGKGGRPIFVVGSPGHFPPSPPLSCFLPIPPSPFCLGIFLVSPPPP